MSADITVLPGLDDPTWVTWQAQQVTAIARTHRVGTTRFKDQERSLYRAVKTGFTTVLDGQHSWEWDDVLGGVITVDRNAPDDHPYLGVLPLDQVTFDAITQTQRTLLRQALDEAEALMRSYS
jgi:hypothetical protein